MLFEFGAVNFTEKFLKEICHRVGFSRIRHRSDAVQSYPQKEMRNAAAFSGIPLVHSPELAEPMFAQP